MMNLIKDSFIIAPSVTNIWFEIIRNVFLERLDWNPDVNSLTIEWFTELQYSH